MKNVGGGGMDKISKNDTLQIRRAEAKSQQIVVQRLLSCLQHLALSKSSTMYFLNPNI